ncbi:hypothetical protein H2200_002859 [Cladophialophora chaetospira]|uniref:CMP/dCMP-type deaminase domain-containing protein n=1 Tax=Cladophialophora chaetospira TaxID=386627 RepID=A0AA39CM69_9EURO|nr:hypothetical protein H2200_002859 [Cladophialophora chaetospira]
MSTPSEPSRSTHLHYLEHALSLARLSPPKPTNFRVGCVLVSFPADSHATPNGADKHDGEILATGYTLELEGNTHAEQNALTKLAGTHGVSLQERGEEALNEILTSEKNVYLYTTLEPCGLRLSGATPCVHRIIATRQGNAAGGVRKVIFGAREPGTFVQDSQSLRVLDEAGVPWEYVSGLDEEILNVAKEGHVEQVFGDGKVEGKKAGTNVDEISPEERRRQEQQPRNPKKRMMEVDLSR